MESHMDDESTRKRMVRLEKATYPEDIRRSEHSGFLIETNAAVKRDRELGRATKFKSEKMAAPALQARREAAKFEHSLDVAAAGPSKERDALMRKHATSSATSPFLSGTPAFTTGQGGQLSYMASNLRAGDAQVVTIHQSDRVLDNPHNKREKEVLVPQGERADERVGMLHVAPPIAGRVRPIFIDKTGDKPKLYLGRAAVARFKDLSQK
jgi:hypothetical protein